MDSPSTYSFASGPQQSGDSGGSGSGAAVYGCPEDGPRSAYVSYADCLPAAADPGAFGLHANADIAKDISATDAMLGSLLAMGASEGSGGEGEGAGEQSSSSGGTAGARSEEARLASVVADCLAALPLQFDVESVGLRFPVCYEESMNTVLVQVRVWKLLVGSIAGAGARRPAVASSPWRAPATDHKSDRSRKCTLPGNSPHPCRKWPASTA